ncbi:MAG: DNA adenine methylase [Methylomonas sp.]|jgi:DNA adenine methylase|uniref:DNA adenine methylase n=1 Tax=Methylomonas sp. TaxID=418 RepID=UPI0025F8D857|nr:DNA adenine methylase [Methylomonas sp.]MCK9607819.1 DNA adenine methylase [Methylomonas sp.]
MAACSDENQYKDKTTSALISICRERGIKGYSRKRKDELITLICSAPSTIALPIAVAKNKSPLRYPGGKTRAIRILREFVQRFYAGRTEVISPFFGGGSFELFLLANGIHRVFANDAFDLLINFWRAIAANPQSVAEKVSTELPISKAKFAAIRALFTENGEQPILHSAEIAAAKYFIINRASFSGSTFCGGYSAQAAKGRLNAAAIDAIRRVNLAGIEFSCANGVDFLAAHPQTEHSFVFADPPYYLQKQYLYGKDGDLHSSFDHAQFAAALQKRNDWILCYNDCQSIRDLYSTHQIFEVSWSYGMNKDKKSSEIIIVP